MPFSLHYGTLMSCAWAQSTGENEDCNGMFFHRWVWFAAGGTWIHWYLPHNLCVVRGKKLKSLLRKAKESVVHINYWYYQCTFFLFSFPSCSSSSTSQSTPCLILHVCNPSSRASPHSNSLFISQLFCWQPHNNQVWKYKQTTETHTRSIYVSLFQISCFLTFSFPFPFIFYFSRILLVFASASFTFSYFLLLRSSS